MKLIGKELINPEITLRRRNLTVEEISHKRAENQENKNGSRLNNDPIQRRQLMLAIHSLSNFMSDNDISVWFHRNNIMF